MKHNHLKKKDPQTFSVPSWQDAEPCHILSPDASQAWHEKATHLHLAKKQATSSFSRMSMCPTDLKMQEAWAKDERNVLRARADLLHTLMTTPDDPMVCLEITDKPPRVCVVYNRMRCDGDVELGPMQSTMSWVVSGAEQPYQQLITMGDHAQASVVADLLRLTHSAMPPRKHVLQSLAALLAGPPPERLEKCPSPSEHCFTRVMMGLADDKTSAPRYTIAWGALDINALEAWQNPSTNASIRMSVLDAAHQATRSASQTKTPLWSNAAYLQVRVLCDDESHNLVFTPFYDSEACSVSHVQFVQSVFDQSGPERGILNLSQNPDDIHPIPLGTIADMKAYVCLKAHKTRRLNEAQLNYVHSRGLMQHKGFDTGLLPCPDRLFLAGNSKGMPPSKSTRISGTGLDVLASSYHLADQVFTTITIVRYPPFGTQFSIRRPPARYNKSLGPPLNPDAPRFNPNHPEDDEEEDDEEDEEGYDDEDQRDEGSETDDMHSTTKDWNEGHREEPEDGVIPLYKNARSRWEVKINRRGRLTHKPKKWDCPLYKGEFYFFDAFYGDPYKLDGRFVLFEVNNGLSYKLPQQKMLDIRQQMIARFGKQWKTQLSFYDNIADNENIQNFWRSSWADFLYSHVSTLRTTHEREMKQHGLSFQTPQHTFWYTSNMNNWVRVFKRDMTADDENRMLHKTTLEEKFNPDSIFGQKMLFYTQKTAAWIKHWTDSGHLSQEKVNSYLHEGRRSLIDQAACRTIPIPRSLANRPRHMQKESKDTVQMLQNRIAALESKLDKATHDKNTQALLQEVLQRLD